MRERGVGALAAALNNLIYFATTKQERKQK